MDFSGVAGNGKGFWPDNVISGRRQLAGKIVLDPGNLNKTRPIVQICEGRFPVFGQAGGFGVKEKVHVLNRKDAYLNK